MKTFRAAQNKTHVYGKQKHEEMEGMHHHFNLYHRWSSLISSLQMQAAGGKRNTPYRRMFVWHIKTELVERVKNNERRSGASHQWPVCRIGGKLETETHSRFRLNFYRILLMKPSSLLHPELNLVMNYCRVAGSSSRASSHCWSTLMLDPEPTQSNELR